MSSIQNVRIDRIDDCYIVSCPMHGSLSLLNSGELIAFNVYHHSEGSDRFCHICHLFEQFGFNTEEAARRTELFLGKLQEDGWGETVEGCITDTPLQLIYLNVTKACNLSCPYCYQGNRHIQHAHTTQNDFKTIVGKVKEINSNCHIVITGGEPFLHPGIFRLLEHLQREGMMFSILSNGVLLTKATAKRLARYGNLRNIQISIDGFSKQVHSITRGNTFDSVMLGIQNAIKARLPFSLAPTVHNGNVHEIDRIAYFALSNNGEIAPNNLRYIPGNRMKHLQLSSDNLVRSINLMYDAVKRVDVGRLKSTRERVKPTRCTPASRGREVCGLGWSLLDIDWNGDVYPCHLLEIEELRLGNVVTDTFDTVFETVEHLGIRTSSLEISKCRSCHFATSCAGGCRADAYFHYGTFKREDSLCDSLYRFSVNNLVTLRSGNRVRDRQFAILPT